MKIIDKAGAKKIALKDVRYGECFRANDGIYMRVWDIEEDEAAGDVPVVSLECGLAARFSKKFDVTPVSGAFVVEEGGER